MKSAVQINAVRLMGTVRNRLVISNHQMDVALEEFVTLLNPVLAVMDLPLFNSLLKLLKLNFQNHIFLQALNKLSWGLIQIVFIPRNLFELHNF